MKRICRRRPRNGLHEMMSMDENLFNASSIKSLSKRVLWASLEYLKSRSMDKNVFTRLVTISLQTRRRICTSENYYDAKKIKALGRKFREACTVLISNSLLPGRSTRRIDRTVASIEFETHQQLDRVWGLGSCTRFHQNFQKVCSTILHFTSVKAITESRGHPILAPVEFRHILNAKKGSTVRNLP